MFLGLRALRAQLGYARRTAAEEINLARVSGSTSRGVKYTGSAVLARFRQKIRRLTRRAAFLSRESEDAIIASCDISIES